MQLRVGMLLKVKISSRGYESEVFKVNKVLLPNNKRADIECIAGLRKGINYYDQSIQAAYWNEYKIIKNKPKEVL